MQPARILHIGDKFGVAGSTLHGMTRLQGWWLSRFDRSSFDVSLCSMKHPEPGTLYLQERGHTVHYLGCRRIDPRALWRLTALCRRLKIDLLHVHQYAASNFGRLVARHLRLPLVLHDHMTDPGIPGYQRFADRLLAGYTTEAIAVSHSTRDFMVSRRSVPPERIHVIVNAAPIQEFAGRGRREAGKIRFEFGIPARGRIVGAIGRLAAQKGFNYLIEAAAIVLRTFPDTYFMIVGDGPERDSLQAQAAALGIADRIIMPGHRWDVADLLAAFDVFALPSLFEGTPLTLLEAMAAGKPIVSTAVDGCGEVLSDGCTALLVDPRQADQLATGIGRLLANPSLRTSLGRAAASVAASDLNIDHCVDRIQEIYSRLLNLR
jgi:glycosyltransferase involved in cell wall biosynthesis